MKREFLQSLTIGDQSLSKEQIDAIMEENGKDIESAKKPFADYEGMKQRLQDATTALNAFDGVDVDAMRGQIETLKTELQTQQTAHQAKLAELAFDGELAAAIGAAKGKNVKAIRALLDVDTLKASENRGADIQSALDLVKAENGYLFDQVDTRIVGGGVAGTGAGTGAEYASTDVDKMSLDEYRVFREKSGGFPKN